MNEITKIQWKKNIINSIKISLDKFIANHSITIFNKKKNDFLLMKQKLYDKRLIKGNECWTKIVWIKYSINGTEISPHTDD